MKAKKNKTIFRCQECGHEAAKWLGKCPDCGKWNSFVEEREAPELGARHVRQLTDFSSEAVAIDDVSLSSFARVATGIGEFDRMIGGGIVPGSLVLLGGAPGIGKSTLMLQVSAALSQKSRVLYISGEESLSQVKARADRLGVRSSALYLVSETNLENMLAAVEKPRRTMLSSTPFKPRIARIFPALPVQSVKSVSAPLNSFVWRNQKV